MSAWWRRRVQATTGDFRWILAILGHLRGRSSAVGAACCVPTLVLALGSLGATFTSPSSRWVIPAAALALLANLAWAVRGLRCAMRETAPLGSAGRALGVSDGARARRWPEAGADGYRATRLGE